MASPMEERLEQADDQGAEVKCYDAYSAQPDLPKNTQREGVINPLGMEPYDWFVLSVFTAAGIQVECIKQCQGAEMYQSRQIVESDDVKLFMRNKDIKKVAFKDKEDMHGLQVHLNPSHTWRVTIIDENLEQHSAISGARAGRKRQVEVQKSTSIENNHQYEVALRVPEHGMRCSVAHMRTLTINIAFKLDDEDRAKWKNDAPLIQQRRIDAVFTNRFATTVQVRVPLAACSRTLCSRTLTLVFRNRQSPTANQTSFRDDARRVYGTTKVTSSRTHALEAERCGTMVGRTRPQSWAPVKQTEGLFAK